MADLAGHYADGRLDHEEYDERLDAIWTARTRADLAVIFSDLPRPQVTYPSPPARAASRSGGRRRRFPLLPVIARARRAEHRHRGTVLAADLPADVLPESSPGRVRTFARSRRLPAAEPLPGLVAGLRVLGYPTREGGEGLPQLRYT